MLIISSGYNSLDNVEIFTGNSTFCSHCSALHCVRAGEMETLLDVPSVALKEQPQDSEHRHASQPGLTIAGRPGHCTHT